MKPQHGSTDIAYTFTVKQCFPQLTIVHHVDDGGNLWATSRAWLVKGKPGSFQKLTHFPMCMPRDLFGWSRLTARAMRSDKCNIFVNSSGKALGIRGGKVYSLMNGKFELLFSIQGDCVLHGGICEDEQGWTYFGEYFMNPERGSVRIFRLDPDFHKREIAYEFPPGSARHVHGVYRDPFDAQAMWVTVGDGKGECAILQTRDRFKSMRTFGDGSQIWRAVALHFTSSHVAWLTDSNTEQNHACRMDRKTGKLEIGQPLDCSGWYGTTTREGLKVAFTTVERGPAIHRQQSQVLVSEDAFHWQEMHAFQKDRWKPVQLFKYGVISVPSGKMSADDFWMSGEGLVGLDGRSLNVRFRRR